MSAKRTVARKGPKKISRKGVAKKVTPRSKTKSARSQTTALARKGAGKKAAAKRAAKKAAATRGAAPKVAKKAPKKAAKKAAATRGAPARKPLARRDRAGHIAPAYAADLRSISRQSAEKDDTGGFLSGARSRDDLAEQLGEEVVDKMTSGEDEGEDVLNQDVDEELGGPFIVTPSRLEFAPGTDPSNPKGSKREPFPRT